MLPIDLRKQKALDANLTAIQQISFTGNLEEQSTIILIIEEAKETALNFSQ